MFSFFSLLCFVCDIFYFELCFWSGIPQIRADLFRFFFDNTQLTPCSLAQTYLTPSFFLSLSLPLLFVVVSQLSSTSGSEPDF